MSTITKLGKVAIVAKGDYVSTVAYEKLDLVRFNGASYLCLASCSGVEPTPNVTSQYWQPFATSVNVATTGVTGIVRPDGDTIKISDKDTGKISVVDEIKGCPDRVTALETSLPKVETAISDAWVSDNKYEVGELVIHNDKLWKCITETQTEEPSASASCWSQTSVDAEITSINSTLTNTVSKTVKQITNASSCSDTWVTGLCTYLKSLSTYSNADFKSANGQEGRFVGYKNNTTVVGHRYTKYFIYCIYYDITNDVLKSSDLSLF